MEAENIKTTRRQLTVEYEKLVKSVNRNRVAAEEIKTENTEDESDLAAINHDRDLLANLQEGEIARLRFVREAIKSLDRGQYGECIRCGTEINEKRLLAVPWATLCIRCQEETEAESIAPRMAPAGLENALLDL